jgi:hypothetical protein
VFLASASWMQEGLDSSEQQGVLEKETHKNRAT